MDWLSILATARDDVGESRNMSVCVGYAPKSKQNSFKIHCGPIQHRAHRHVDATPGGVRDPDVRARDQLLGVATSAGRIAARRGEKAKSESVGPTYC